ncbi:MAG: putative lipid II flippase FtsW [Lachnospiraceae bacterium]|nr:putative lipid II flippase FtsW [Lachnospiraceae bacterium]
MANRFIFRKKSRVRYFDYTMLLTLIILLVFGLVMLYSVSSYDGSVQFNDPAYYLRKQAISTVLGLAVMFGVMMVPYHFFERLAGWAYVIALALLGLVIKFGVMKNGAKRWIYVFGISIQPAEIAKLAIILMVSYIAVRLGKQIATWKGFLITMGVSLPMVAAIYFITSNLSSAIIVFGITFLMCFVASPDYLKFILMTLVIVAVAAAVVYFIATHPDSDLGVRSTRILIWLDPEKYASGKGYQTLQALYAIGSGGIFGKGIGQSMQKLGFLPEAQNDMIFSIICEELGFFGGLCVIALFLLLLWRCVLTANSAKDMYGALLTVGFIGHIAIQVILNIAVVTNTIPNTGISLPFISYGGSSVVSLLFEVGLVFSVQRSIMIKDYV